MKRIAIPLLALVAVSATAATPSLEEADRAAAGAVRQPPLSVRLNFWHFGASLEPAPAGTATLQDGTEVSL